MQGESGCAARHCVWISDMFFAVNTRIIIWFVVCCSLFFLLFSKSLKFKLLLLLLLLKKVSSVRLRESDMHPISPKTPAPQYQPIDRKKRNWKRVEDYSRDRAA